MPAKQRNRTNTTIPPSPQDTMQVQLKHVSGATGEELQSLLDALEAVRTGNLTVKLQMERGGIFGNLADSYNGMVGLLSQFSGEVTRVAREVGTDGKLGGQAQVEGVSGIWKELTENVNAMASNLTGQVRNIAQVTTAVAQGDLAQKITVDVRGEVLALKNTINEMVENLRAFSGEVTRVAKEVGTDGKLGGQAQVEGVSGIWKELTENVNAMASNLTGQVRNIAQVTTAVAQGDLTQKITVDVRGEVLELKNTINSMVDTLSRLGNELTEQRKRELERLSELEKFQKVTVGRELKMIELKTEIQDLKKQLCTQEGR